MFGYCMCIYKYIYICTYYINLVLRHHKKHPSECWSMLVVQHSGDLGSEFEFRVQRPGYSSQPRALKDWSSPSYSPQRPAKRPRSAHQAKDPCRPEKGVLRTSRTPPEMGIFNNSKWQNVKMLKAFFCLFDITKLKSFHSNLPFNQERGNMSNRKNTYVSMSICTYTSSNHSGRNYQF